MCIPPQYIVVFWLISALVWKCQKEHDASSQKRIFDHLQKYNSQTYSCIREKINYNEVVRYHMKIIRVNDEENYFVKNPMEQTSRIFSW